MSLNDAPTVGAKYHDYDCSSFCTVKEYDRMRKRVLIQSDSGREYLDLAEFNMKWRKGR